MLRLLPPPLPPTNERTHVGGVYLGVGTVLRLEKDACSKVHDQGKQQVSYPPLPPAKSETQDKHDKHASDSCCCAFTQQNIYQV